ncbi:MAG TPA: nickel-dependent hydrogenase large subunit [Acidimicrobiales bacterium]|jgi:hydrogenase large subunit|nr:nickel-dependent hydrogenase large subunit [Acidimicrobiales bacterium]
MCFNNLPIELDASGRARLAGDVPRPFSLETSSPLVTRTDADREAQISRLLVANGHVKDLNMDPVTRVAGALAVHVSADLMEGRHLDAHVQAKLFRGYEMILKGRDPRDAIFVSSRACGVCGGVHSHAAAYAVEMAMGIAPPPLGTVIRNTQESAEMGYDNPLHLYLLAGPDYSEAVVRAVNPELWPRAERWLCPGVDHHGFRTMADLMTALNPLTGSLYREGLEFTRLSRQMFVVLAGKYPHPQTVVPGGVSSTVTLQQLNEYHSLLSQVFDYAQRMLAVWNDIPEFFYDCDDRYRDVGARPMNLIDPGYWDDPHAYDADYANCNEWGRKRWSTPGVVVDGQLVTTRLTDINIGWEEFVSHAYYEEWKGDRWPDDPLGNPISPYHPWNKETIPAPGARDFKDRYTWACTPRWDRKVVEAGAYARLFTTAMARLQPENPFMEATGRSLRMLIPKGMTPETEVEWYVPDVWNALERNRGRAYHYVFSQLVGLASLMEAYRLFDTGQRRVAAFDPTELERHMPRDERRSVGWWGAGRGWLTHHLVMDKGKITNYQICTPSTINASPRDPWGQPGPYEEAVMNTPIIEDLSDPSTFTSIDMLRTIRSFDPCMPCTTHVDTGKGTVLREVTTCSCGE